MSGIMAAVAGGTQNVIYGAGLYLVGSSADTSPISFSSSSSGGSTLSYNYTWIGYYRPAATGTVTLGLATSYQEVVQNIGNYNWGGGGYSIAYLWLGSTAKSGYTTGNANIVSNNQTATYTTSLVAGVYYPVRINMIMSLPYDPNAYYTGNFFDPYYAGWADGAFNFQSGGSTTVTNLIWYNTLSNGF